MQAFQNVGQNKWSGSCYWKVNIWLPAVFTSGFLRPQAAHTSPLISFSWVSQASTSQLIVPIELILFLPLAGGSPLCLELGSHGDLLGQQASHWVQSTPCHQDPLAQMFLGTGLTMKSVLITNGTSSP